MCGANEWHLKTLPQKCEDASGEKYFIEKKAMNETDKHLCAKSVEKCVSIK